MYIGLQHCKIKNRINDNYTKSTIETGNAKYNSLKKYEIHEIF